MKNVLLLGASGYIGSAFLDQLQVEGYNVKPLSRGKDFDYTDMSKLKEFIDIGWHDSGFETRNCIVINCAGYTGKPNVDRCELYKDETLLGNVVLPAQLSEVLYARGIPLCHISSGCIYDGYVKRYTEEDPPNFSFESDRHNWKKWQTKCSFYSGTKALAERVVKNNPLAYIFRLRIPFDEHTSTRNYITKLLTYDKLIDMTNSFSHRYDFVKYCLGLISVNAPYGIYNVTNKDSMTTKEVIELIKHYKVSEKEFAFYKNYDEFANDITTARSNCLLDTSKMEELIDVRSAESAFNEALSRYEI